MQYIDVQNGPPEPTEKSNIDAITRKPLIKDRADIVTK